jgi:hypothetical protein
MSRVMCTTGHERAIGNKLSLYGANFKSLLLQFRRKLDTQCSFPSRQAQPQRYPVFSALFRALTFAGVTLCNHFEIGSMVQGFCFKRPMEKNTPTIQRMQKVIMLTCMLFRKASRV